MIVTKQFLLRNPALPLDEALFIFLNSEIASKNFPLEFYSRERLFSRKARKRWMNGDIKTITLISNEYKMNNHFDLTDDHFLDEIGNCTLPPELFDHEAHLRLAWLYIKRNGLKESTALICNQITNYVNHLGARDKYNATLTVAAVNIVYSFMNASHSNRFLDFVLEFPELKSDFKRLVGSHYSFDVFSSSTAKQKFLPPDLMPFT